MNYCEIFDWACKFLKPITENEFNKGYATGLGVVFSVALLLLIIKIIFKIIFRRRRCNEVLASASDGNVSISVNAIEDTVRSELRAFPSVQVSRIRLYRIRKRYMINLVCEYDGKDGGLPQITQKIKLTLSTMFKDFFGVNSIRQINLKFERLSRDKSAASAAPASAEVSSIDVKPVSDAGDNSDTDIQDNAF